MSTATRRTLSPRAKFRVLRESGFRCVYCGATGDNVRLEVDHVVPRSVGGTDGRENLVAACFDCNRGKRDQTGVLPPTAWGMTDDVRYCADGCPRCQKRGVFVFCIPIGVTPNGTSKDPGYSMTYQCMCGHGWRSYWSVALASEQHYGMIRQVLDGDVVCVGLRTFAYKPDDGGAA